jgi:hypothetical protein
MAAGEHDVICLLTEGRRKREQREVASGLSAVSIYVCLLQRDVLIAPRPFEL